MAVAARPRSPLITRHGVRVPGAAALCNIQRVRRLEGRGCLVKRVVEGVVVVHGGRGRAGARGRRRRAAQELLGRLDLRDAVGKLAGHDAVAAQAPVQRVVEAGALLGNWTLSASSVGRARAMCGARVGAEALARRRGAPG